MRLLEFVSTVKIEQKYNMPLKANTILSGTIYRMGTLRSWDVVLNINASCGQHTLQTSQTRHAPRTTPSIHSVTTSFDSSMAPT